MKMRFIHVILFSICGLLLLLPNNIFGETEAAKDLMTEEFVSPKTVKAEEVPSEGLERLKEQIVRLKKELLAQRSKYNFFSVMALCFLSLITVSLTLGFLSRQRFSASAGDIVNAIGLIIIVYGTIILVLVAEAEQQLTAAIGILGAIAGYLFGTIQLRVTPPKK